MEFFVSEEVKALGVKILGVQIEGMDNKTITEEYLTWRKDKVAELLETYKDFNAKEDPIIEGFYALHAKVNVPRRKNLPASENLIKLLEKKQELFPINKAVDIYNLISIESKLALGAHDMDKVTGNITLRLQDGSENFIPLGQNEPKPVKAGEYSYIDDANDILCHLEIRQVEKDKVTEESKNLFYIVQGNAATPDDLVQKTAEDVIYWTTKFCGGTGRIL